VTSASQSDFIERLRAAGQERYHDRHPFHARMHDGMLSRGQLALWALNRYYYQTRIPIKDALILAKSEDPSFRRRWIRRIVDHDGVAEGDGGLALWRRLAMALDVQEAELDDQRAILPGVRRACDGYVELVRGATLLEAVAASLTEFFAPALMRRRLASWQTHYPWVPHEALDYFRIRIQRAEEDAAGALELVLTLATTPELEQRATVALVKKAELLWQMLDAIQAAAETNEVSDALLAQ
jgi:pyrroloquinoline-quinone synthase